jgi:tetratricopeptide (TPR) repeat protein
MKKLIIYFVSMVGIGATAVAQTIDDVKTMIYYDKYQSAKGALEKMITANPTDANAQYWLGQTYLIYGRTKEATDIYNKALASTNNASIITAGLAHVAAYENDHGKAKILASQAMTGVKNNDQNLLTAIGKACGELNVNPQKRDDRAAADLGFYGISILEKITNAFTAKKNNPELAIALADCLTKTNQGGKAVNELDKAIAFTPKYANLYFKAGLLAGVVGNTKMRDDYFGKANAADPKFASVYKTLYFEGIKENNYIKAKDNYAKYFPLTDVTPEVESYNCDLVFLSKDYNGCVACVDNLVTKQGANVSPRLYMVKAYAYEQLKDSVKALSFVEQYFTKQKPEDIKAVDYHVKGRIMSKVPRMEPDALAAYKKAIELDTSNYNKALYTNSAAQLAVKSGNLPEAASLYEEAYKYKVANAGTLDIYNVANTYYQLKNYVKADEWYGVYTTKYPNDIYGHYQRAIINKTIDSTYKGTAAPFYDKVIEIGMTDTLKYKSYLSSAYYYNALVASQKGDSRKAVEWFEKILVLDPTDEGTKENIRILKGGGRSTTPATKPATTRPAGSGGTRSTTTTPKPITATPATPKPTTTPKPKPKPKTK